MKIIKFVSLALIIFCAMSFLIINCGAEKKKPEITSNDFLPEKFDNIGVNRTSEIRTFDEKTLWEYINGGAEIYLIYNYIQVITADYKKGEFEIVVDIYQFKNSDNAFGIYSAFRPPDASIIKLGVEGFSAPASLNFVKGDYFIRLTGYSESAESDLVMINLAEELEKLIPGTEEIPSTFSFFPGDSVVAISEKYFAESFMGQKFLTEAYSRDYKIGEDSVTLFLLFDETGGKYLDWSNYAEKVGMKKAGIEEIPYDDEYSFILEDNYYGNIIIGLKKGKLIGIINYSDKIKDFAAQWITSIN